MTKAGRKSNGEDGVRHGFWARDVRNMATKNDNGKVDDFFVHDSLLRVITEPVPALH